MSTERSSRSREATVSNGNCCFVTLKWFCLLLYVCFFVALLHWFAWGSGHYSLPFVAPLCTPPLPQTRTTYRAGFCFSSPHLALRCNCCPYDPPRHPLSHFTAVTFSHATLLHPQFYAINSKTLHQTCWIYVRPSARRPFHPNTLHDNSERRVWPP